MCFYDDDCDWSAEEYDDCGRRGPACKCIECGRDIPEGQWRRSVWMREHEGCQICEDESSDDFISDNEDDYDSTEDYVTWLAELAAHEHRYGEEWSGEVCRECSLLLEAIYDLERIEGCPEDARQPAFGELTQTIFEDGRHDGGKYAQHAIALFPELAPHIQALID